MARRNTSLGFSTIEILIAFAVGIIFLSSAMMVAFTDATLRKQISIDTGHASVLDTILDSGGLQQATQHIEHIMHELMTNWYTVLPITNTQNVSYTSIAPHIVDISPCVKQITGDVSWNSLQNRTRDISFDTALSDMGTAMALGRGNCDPLPPDEWNSPRTLPQSITLSDVNANDLIIVPDQGKRIAILATTAVEPTKEDVYLYDVSDPSNPSSILGSLDTGKGINAITRNGAYVFALQNDTTNQLQVIRVFDSTKQQSDPAYYTPTLITQVSLRNVSGAYPEGRSIAYYNDFLFIGTWNNNIPATSPEFLIYNVSDPTNPTFTGSYNLNHSINSIMVQDTYAYLATTDNTGELTILNIADPTSISKESTYDIPDNTTDAEEVYVLGPRAYLGLTRRAGKAELLILDVTNPTLPSHIGGINLGLRSSTKVTGIDVRGRYVFVGTDAVNQEFRVLDITNPTDPKPIPCSPFTYSTKIRDLQYEDGFIFLANHTDEVIRIIYDTNGTTCN